MTVPVTRTVLPGVFSPENVFIHSPKTTERGYGISTIPAAKLLQDNPDNKNDTLKVQHEARSVVSELTRAVTKAATSLFFSTYWLILSLMMMM